MTIVADCSHYSPWNCIVQQGVKIYEHKNEPKWKQEHREGITEPLAHNLEA